MGADDPLDRLVEERATEPAIRTEFRSQLDELEGGLIAAAEQVADAIVPLTTTFLDGDHAAADEWLLRHRQLTRVCRDLEELGYVVLARQSPVAGDLRRVVTVVRASGDVQRTGNLLRHIASSLTWIDPTTLPGGLRRIIEEFGEVVSTIFHGAVEAWRGHDSLAAVELQRLDDRADELQRALLTEIHEGRCSVEEAVSLALIARYYERIGDHGVELGRGVTYAMTGERLMES